ncbi:MAG: NAD(P)/FAD-dependent oxidoreductase [Evtepia gabavorous]
MEEVGGDDALRYLRYRNTETGQVTEYRPPAGETFGLFVFAGYQPATELLQGVADLDEQGYVLTDRGQKTSADGLYAAGDVCQKPLRQVVTAVGDGALAATGAGEVRRGRPAEDRPRAPGPQAPLPAPRRHRDRDEAGGLVPRRWPPRRSSG